MSLGHKGREIRQGCSDHRSPPPFPSLLQPPIEHRRCCHPPPLSRGVHLQFLAQIALEPHLITPRYLSNVSLLSQEGKFPNFFLPGITNSSLQFLLTDNFEGGIIYRLLNQSSVTKLLDPFHPVTFRFVRMKTFPLHGFQFVKVASLGQHFSKMIKKRRK